MVKKKETLENCYFYRVMCKNCDNRKWIEIPKSVTVEDYLERAKELSCGICGCKEWVKY